MSSHSPGLPQRGSLREHSIAELLLGCARQRLTGALRLERGKLRKRLLFRDGAPTMAESNAPGESICEHLLRAKKISRVDIQRVVQRMRTRGGSEAHALLAEKLSTPVDLYAALKTQVRRRLLDCFGWEDGQFTIEKTDPPGEDGMPLRADPIATLYEGVATHYSVARLKGALADRLEQYPRPGPVASKLWKRLPLSDADTSRIAALDGRRRLEAALEDAPLAVWAAVWLLDRWGALHYQRQDKIAHAEGPGAGAAHAPRIEIVVGGRAVSEAPQRPSHPGRNLDSRTAREELRPNREAEEVRQEILALHGALAERSHYELLNLDRNAEIRAIKKAYFQLAKRYHPDALSRLQLDDIKDEAKEVFAQIATAYEILSDPKRRRAYDDPAPLDDELDADRIMRAESLYRKAEVLLRAGKFAAALPFLEPAVTLWPQEANYQSDLGWALYKKAPSDPYTARRYLAEASRLAPQDGEIAQRFSLVLRALGDERGAVQVLLQARKKPSAKGAR